MALGVMVWVGPGEHGWDPRAVTVLPNATLHLAGRGRETLLAGAWLMAEASGGSVTRANLSFEADDAWGATVRVRCAAGCRRGGTGRRQQGGRAP